VYEHDYKNVGPGLTERTIIERGQEQTPHGVSEIVFFVVLLVLAAAVILAGIFRWIV
jgi:hypothetical protein